MNKTALLLLAALFFAPGVQAKPKAAYEIEKLPAKQDEADLWESASKHEMRLRNSGTVFRNREMEEYLESLADRLIGDSLDHLGIELDFMLVAEPTLNGWVYPYGTIGLHTGLLVRMDNEAQLASIVAHEISHFMQRHTYREVLDRDKQSVLGKGIGFLASAALAKETGTFDKGVMNFTGELWSNLATSGYSKKNEYRSDEEGLELMARAGLEIGESIPAFQKLGENKVYGAGDPRKMWSSHPRLEDRIKNLQKEIRKTKKKKGFVAGKIPDPVAYYKAIAPALLINARLDVREQKYQRARDSLDKYMQAVPDNPTAHFLRGESYRMQSFRGPDFGNAINAYREALVHDSGYAAAYREIGMALRIEGNGAEAVAALETYLELSPEAPDAGIVRGYIEGLQ